MSFALDTLSSLRPSLASLAGALLFMIHAAAIVRAITRPGRTPAARVAWVAVLAYLPIIGVIAYVLLGETSIGRLRTKRLREAQNALHLPAASALPHTNEQANPLFALGESINGLPPVAGNRITLLGAPQEDAQNPTADCDAAIATLIDDMAAAREHIHISFYIWLNDGNGGKVADAVCAAAQRGVACRVMVDALGSRTFIHSPRWRQLQQAGVKTVATLDDIPRLGHLAVGRLDLRNHRKIVVIDNAIAYCGSQNCADPAFRVQAKYAPWIDMLLRCEGPIARQAQSIFLSAWMAESHEKLGDLPAAQPLPLCFSSSNSPDGVVAQMFGTGPDSKGNAMSDMFVAAIYAARSELIITTPYFVPDEAILRALCAAPRRGVQTTIIFPQHNNSLLVGSACRSNYADLLVNGVQVFEYPLGLLHSKSITLDGEMALVGSANIDRRSLQLNFENNLLIADKAVTQSIRARQLAYSSVAERVGMETVRGWPLHQRLFQNAVAMMAPLL